MNKSMKINKRVLLWTLCMCILIRPAGLVHVLGIESISRMACLVLSGFTILMAIQSNSIPTTNMVYIMMNLWLVLCTLFRASSVDLYECFIVACTNIGIVCFICYAMRKDMLHCLKAVYVSYTALIIANFFYMFVKPEGYNLSEWISYGRGYYLFGHQNTTITYVLPAICVSLIGYRKNIIKRWQMLTTILFSLGSIIKIFSATSLVGLGVFWGVLFLLERGKVKKYLKAGWAIWIGTGACIGIVFFNIQTKGLIADFIVNVLHRTTNFTSRTTIWENALRVISSNWLIGIGYRINTTFQSLIHGSSAHNEYLFMILQGGVVLLALFYTFFIFSKRVLESSSETYVSRVFTALYFSLFIQFLTETHMHRLAVLLALIGCAEMMITDELKAKY